MEQSRFLYIGNRILFYFRSNTVIYFLIVILIEIEKFTSLPSSKLLTQPIFGSIPILVRMSTKAFQGMFTAFDNSKTIVVTTADSHGSRRAPPPKCA